MAPIKEQQQRRNQQQPERSAAEQSESRVVEKPEAAFDVGSERPALGIDLLQPVDLQRVGVVELIVDEDSGGEENYPYLFQAFIPNAGEGEGLRIHYGEKVFWHRPAPDEKGSLGDFRARLREDLLVVEWQFRSSSEVEPEFWLQWSNDEGKTWNALATSIGCTCRG